jgi:hypothetical protein
MVKFMFSHSDKPILNKFNSVNICKEVDMTINNTPNISSRNIDLEFENRMPKSLCYINQNQAEQNEMLKQDLDKMRTQIKHLESRLLKKNQEIIDLSYFKHNYKQLFEEIKELKAILEMQSQLYGKSMFEASLTSNDEYNISMNNIRVRSLNNRLNGIFI